MAGEGAGDGRGLQKWLRKIGDRWRRDKELRHIVIAFVLIIAGLQHKELVRLATAMAEIARAVLSTQQQSEQDRARDDRAQFSNGVALLAQVRGDNKPDLEARISGIYTLESLVKANEVEYRKQVMQSLVAYIKNNAQITSIHLPSAEHENQLSNKADSSARARHLGEDVKAAFAVLKNLDDLPNNPYIDRYELSFNNANFNRLHFGNEIEWIDGVDLSNAKLESSYFLRAKLNRANLRGAKLKNAEFSGAKLHCVNLRKAELHNAGFIDAKLNGADFREAELHNTNLRRAELHNADFRRAQLHGTNLRRAELHDADLRGAEFHGADLFSAKLNGSDLRGAEFHGADLFAANFHGAYFIDAEFHGADLRGAEFHGATLRNVEFHGANLIWTEFHGADLRGAEFHGATLLKSEFHGADLRGAEFDVGYQSTLKGTYVNLIGIVNILMDNESIEELSKILQSSNVPQSKIDRILYQCKYSPTFNKSNYSLKNVWHDQQWPLEDEPTLNNNFDWQDLLVELADLYENDASYKEKYAIFLHSLLRNFREATQLQSRVDEILENDPVLRKAFQLTSVLEIE